MFVRVKKVGPYQYLQIAENRREGKRVKQPLSQPSAGSTSSLPAAPSTNSCAPRLGSRCAATPSASPARLHNASGSDCPTPCVRSTLRRRSLTRVPEHRRVESRRTLACSAKAFSVPDNSLTYNAFYSSTVEDESNSWRMTRSSTSSREAIPEPSKNARCDAGA